MKIELDFAILEETGMSADDYVYLYIIYRKGFNYLQTLALKPDLLALQHKGYIKIGDSVEEHIIRQEFIDLFVSNFQAMFAELVGTYPMKVNTGRGTTRVLHATDPDAKSNDKARERYKKVVGDKAYKHREIMKCLDRQLLVNKDSLGFLQNLEVWINNYTWEKYENLDEHATQNDSTKPRITRSL